MIKYLNYFFYFKNFNFLFFFNFSFTFLRNGRNRFHIVVIIILFENRRYSISAHSILVRMAQDVAGAVTRRLLLDGKKFDVPLGERQRKNAAVFAADRRRRHTAIACAVWQSLVARCSDIFRFSGFVIFQLLNINNTFTFFLNFNVFTSKNETL